MSQETFIVSVPLYATDWDGDNKKMHLFRAPSAGDGGPIKIKRAAVVVQNSTGAGTSFGLALHLYDTIGTTLAGTIAGEIGHTSSPWVAGTPKEFTIADGDVAAGQWVVLQKEETNSSDPLRGIVTIEYQMGV
jgi:hypothetical protein